MKIIAVVPAYNESKTIASVVEDLKNKVDSVVVVDDGSQDVTSSLAKSGGAYVLRHFINRGQGAALKTGIDYALAHGADIIITFDADGQHDISDIDALVKPIIEGSADVMLGSRFKKNFLPPGGGGSGRGGIEMPLLRYIILKLALLFTKLTTGLAITDTHNGLRALSRNAAQKINIHQDGMAHASEILEEIALHEIKYCEVPVTISYSEYSKKKGQSSWGMFRIIWDLVVGKISK